MAVSTMINAKRIKPLQITPKTCVNTNAAWERKTSTKSKRLGEDRRHKARIKVDCNRYREQVKPVESAFYILIEQHIRCAPKCQYSKGCGPQSIKAPYG